MSGEIPTEFEQCTYVARREFALVAFCEGGQVGWGRLHGERSRPVSFAGLSMTGSAVLNKRCVAGGEVPFALRGFWFALLARQAWSNGKQDSKAS